MIEINNDIYLVKGFKNSAIYDTITHKVYSINKNAYDIILRYIEHNSVPEDINYINLLTSNKLISPNFKCDKGKNLYVDWKPEIAWLEITKACNLKCIHCYEGTSHKSGQNLLGLNEWFNVIDQLISLDIKRIIIIGGEPSCSKYAYEILNYASQFNVKVVYFTNATLLDNKLMSLIIKNNIYVKFSIYGHKANIHDKITNVAGSFDKTVLTINKLLNNNVEVEASLIIMRENQYYLNDIVSWLKDKNIIYKRFDIIRSVESNNISQHDVDDIDIMKKVYKIKPNFSITKQRLIQNINYNSCWYGKIAIIENGDVLNCVFARDNIIGNVRDAKLEKIINDKISIQCHNLRIDAIDWCKSCEYRYACNDCRPIALSATKSIFGKIQRCLYNPYSGMWDKFE